jgi:hypothetical protein
MLGHRYLLILSAAWLLLSADRTPHAEELRSQIAQATSGSDVLVSQGVVRCPAADPSLEPEDPATTSGLPSTQRFAAQDHFKVGVSPQAAVKIAWLGAMFAQRFLGKSEHNDGGAILRRFALRRPARNDEIIAAMNIHHETKLTDLWCLLSRQPNGEPGTLLTNAIPNILYVRDVDGVVAAVDAVWGGAGWEIGASSVAGTRQWLQGHQVIAR